MVPNQAPQASSSSATPRPEYTLSRLRAACSLSTREWGHAAGLGSVLQHARDLKGEHAKEAIEVLKKCVDAADGKLWPEEPFPTMYLKQDPEGSELMITDHFRWTLIQLLRYSTPTRLGEAVEYCRKMTVQGAASHAIGKLQGNMSAVKAKMNHMQQDSQLYLYYGVAMALKGGMDEEARDMLKAATSNRVQVGERNSAWSLSHLARVLRRLNEIPAAEKIEKDLVKHLKAKPNLFSPAVMQELFLLPGEQSTPLMDQIKALTPKAMTESQMKKSADYCNYCKQSGLGLKLSKCGNCLVTMYCSKEHQNSDWPLHKATCKMITKRRKENLAKAAETPHGQEWLEMNKQFTEWGKTIRRVVNRITPSALGLHEDVTRATTHALLVTIRQNVGGTGLDSFQILDARVMTRQEMLHQGIVTLEQIQSVTPQMVIGSEVPVGLVILDGGSLRMSIATPVTKDSLRKTVYQADWFERLQKLELSEEYDFN